MLEEKKINNVLWSDELESVIKNIGESCTGYKWMNIFSARKEAKIYDTLMYISIILGAVTGALSASLQTYESYSWGIQTTITILSFASGTLISVTKFSSFNQKSNSHKNIGTEFGSLEGDIIRQLGLRREDRKNPIDFFNTVSDTFDKLFAKMPLISDDIYQEWIKYAKDNNLNIPKELGTVVKKEQNNENMKSIVVNKNIEIVVKEESSKFSEGRMKYEMNRLYNG
jgi:hypothetical protein